MKRRSQKLLRGERKQDGRKLKGTNCSHNDEAIGCDDAMGRNNNEASHDIFKYHYDGKLDVHGSSGVVRGCANEEREKENKVGQEKARGRKKKWTNCNDDDDGNWLL
ncbi:hypothetical protein Nepgr_030686 [Nepenthes gracilis]|uniref:Uncharacterized protein n=1 Tax=Nepenthes gracilis TaxID=150966 RepID=A0AAD3Y4H2_NEPGR|nr:hypothetical protein Nepgr_030686 [Nepenthes gracilis]